MQDVIIISGSALGLGIARSLGERGIRSIVIYEKGQDMARYSRYVKLAVGCDDLKQDAVGILRTRKDEWSGSLVLAGADETIEALYLHKADLAGYILPFGEHITELLDKHATYMLADRVGVPRPEYIKGRPKVYPCIIKPRVRHEFFPIFNQKLFVVRTPEEFEEKMSLCRKHKIKAIVSEIIPGPETNLYEFCFYVSRQGRLIGRIIDRKLRQMPKDFGIGRVCFTCHSKEIDRLGSLMLKAIPGFRGPGHIEFKLDERDRKFKLIEINPRYISRVHFHSRAGVNMPWMTYMDWMKGKQMHSTEYRDNIYTINLYQDIISFRKEGVSLRHYLKPYFKKVIWNIESLRDPLPSMAHWAGNIKDQLKRISRRWR